MKYQMVAAVITAALAIVALLRLIRRQNSTILGFQTRAALFRRHDVAGAVDIAGRRGAVEAAVFAAEL
ncbi:hypothetical protein GGE39_003794 [Rhizobium leguminosarum]|jgi:hypothetical protein|nr:hypothetical protein [Rhizobium leguminosarum]